MNRKLIFVAVAFFALLLCLQMVSAYTYLDYKTAIEKAADRLVALQSPTDAGWDWIVTGLSSHTGAASAPNLYGVTAIDLIHAYKLTGNSAYLAAAKSAADFMKYGDPTIGDFWNGHDSYYWGFSFDYRFLMEFAAVSGDTSYSTYATAAWTWQKANIPRYADGNQGSGAGTLWDRYANFWIGANKYCAAAWGTGDWGLAALEMGDTVWAQHMADVIHANMANILADVDVNDFITLGQAWALKFFVTSPYASANYAADVASLITTLEGHQALDGSWSTITGADFVQDTAYAVMALWTAGEFTAAQKGADWLVTTQLANGGWLEPDGEEYSEVDSEAMSALALAMPPSPVGGEWVPINTIQMLVQIVGSAIAMSAIIASFLGFKRIKRKQN